MSAALFKVGDKVRIKDSINEDTTSDWDCSFVEPMEKYRGQVLTIANIDSYMDEVYDEDENNYVEQEVVRYHIKEDDGEWNWVDEFFEPANITFAEKNIMKLQNGEIRVMSEGRLYLLDGTSIGVENYTGRKHNFDSSFDIIEVRRPNSNFLFEFDGEVVVEE